MNPIILYNNLLDDGTLTASSTNASSEYDVDNVIDWKSWTIWKAADTTTQTIKVVLSIAKAADCVGIYNHNLGTAGSTVKVQYKEGISWVTAKTLTPSNDKIILATFTSASSTEWQLEISNNGVAPFIGVLLIGSALEFEWPPTTPLDLAPEGIKTSASFGETGLFLGGLAEYNPLTPQHTYRDFTWNWYTNSFKPFWDNHGKKLYPFFYATDLSNKPNDIVWCTFDPNYVHNAPYSISTYVDTITLTLRGVSEE